MTDRILPLERDTLTYMNDNYLNIVSADAEWNPQPLQ